MGRIPTMEEQLQETLQYVTPAHAADWRVVDKKSGDLLYVGSSGRLWNRLNPSNHIMWSIYTHETRESPLIRIALWLQPNDAQIEAGMTALCLPLWSNDRGGTTWTWRDPDLVVSPKAFDPSRTRKRAITLDAVGTYAWLCLPRGTSPYGVMVVLADARKSRRVQTPKLWRCPTTINQLWCLYTRLAEPSPETVCPRCRLSWREAKRLSSLDNLAKLRWV